MKRLVLLGEGHGEVPALPILVSRLLTEKQADVLYLDRSVMRDSPTRLVKWDKSKAKPDYSGWVKRIELAARRREIGAILAIYDGDAPTFPAGSKIPFCAKDAAASMAMAATMAGAGKVFSLSVVFACAEYETWLVAGIESLAGRRTKDGRSLIPADAKFPEGEPESHGKKWLERICPRYRPTRDQAELTDLIDLDVVRTKNLRSFQRLNNALDKMLQAVATGIHISTPA